MAFRWKVAVTIASGQSLSGEYDFSGGATRIGIIMPATWTAASLTFQVASASGGTYQELTNEGGTAVNPAVTAGASNSLETSGPYISPFRWFKVRSGTAGAPVAQGAARIVTFIFQR
jgi:hypothetical protein